MSRRILSYMIATVLLTGLAPVVAAQDAPDLDVVCASLSADPISSGWNEFRLQEAIASDQVDVLTVSPGSACEEQPRGAVCLTVAGSGPEDGWSSSTLPEAVADGRAQIVLLALPGECARAMAETLDRADAPPRVPLQILETAVMTGDLFSGYAAVVLNPNEDTWAAQGMPATVHIFDETDTEIETGSAFVTLLPGQAGALLGFQTAPGVPDRIEIDFEGADFNWLPVDSTAAVVAWSDIEREPDDFLGFHTVGSLQNTSDRPLEDVSIVVIHRGEAGEIVGGDLGFAGSIAPGQSASFRIPHIGGLGVEDVFWTGAYYQLGSVL